MVHQGSFIGTATTNSHLQIRNKVLKKQQSKNGAGEEQQDELFGQSFHILNNHGCLSCPAKEVSIPCQLF